MIKPEVIKAFRKVNGLTQKELADIAGASQQKIRLAWEKSGITEKQIKEAQLIVNLLMFQQINEI